MKTKLALALCLTLAASSANAQLLLGVEKSATPNPHNNPTVTPIYVSASASGTTTISAVTTANCTAGSTIVVAALNRVSGYLSGVTDGLSTTYSFGSHVAATNFNGNFGWGAPIASTISSGSTITLTWAGSPSGGKGAIIWCVTPGTSSPVSPDLTALAGISNQTGTIGTYSSGTLTYPNEVVFGLVGINNGSNTPVQPSGWTGTYAQNSSILIGGYQIVSSNASVTYNPTWTTSVSFGSNIVTFGF